MLDEIADPALVKPLGAVVQRLQELLALPADWDSYGAERISPVAVSRAKGLVRNVASQYWPQVGTAAVPSFVAPIANGGVHLEWSGRDAEFELEVGEGAKLSYLWIDRRLSPERTFHERHDVDQHEVIATLGHVFGTAQDV
jgi:hypothetical protein